MLSDVGNSLKKWDLFESDVPGLTLKGRERTQTHAGGAISMAILTVLLLFSLLKLSNLLDRHNPTINTYLVEDAFD